MPRVNLGLAHVDAQQGSSIARKRAKVLLRTLFHELTIDEAIAQLGLSRTRIQDLRKKLLQASVDAVELGHPGRPPNETPSESERVKKLRAKVSTLQHALRLEQAKHDIERAMNRATAEKQEARPKRRKAAHR